MWQADVPPPQPAPTWQRLPSASDTQRFYPGIARRLSLTGRAVLICEVSAKGTLVACRAEDETPPEAGFGPAALRMAALIRMQPRTPGGAPVAGGVVRIPIRFSPPRGASGVTEADAALCYGVTANLAERAGAPLEASKAAEFWRTFIVREMAAAGKAVEGQELLNGAGAKAERAAPAFAEGACLAKAKESDAG